jgi:hypothetical protein
MSALFDEAAWARKLDLGPMENERFLDSAFCVAAALALFGDEWINQAIQDRLVSAGYRLRPHHHPEVEAAFEAGGDAAAKDKVRELLSSGEARREFYAKIDCLERDYPGQGYLGDGVRPARLGGRSGTGWFYAAVKPSLGSDYRSVLAAMRRHANCNPKLLIAGRFDWPRAKIEKAAATENSPVAVKSLAEVEALIPDLTAPAPVLIKEPIEWRWSNYD